MFERIVQDTDRRYSPRKTRIPSRRDLPDIDLLLSDPRSRTILVCELKWFIGPAEVRETIYRSKELAKGVAQVKALVESIKEDSAVRSSLLPGGPVEVVAGCVVSANWIGHVDVQDPAVPIVRESHFIEAVNTLDSLPTVVRWLDDRCYLPQRGEDFDVRAIVVDIAGYELSWYGVQSLVEGTFTPRFS